MALDIYRVLRRCAVAVAVVLCLASIWTVQADTGGVRPTGHGLANVQDPGPASPAMAAFFRPGPDVTLTEAKNASEPAWSLVPPGPQRTVVGTDRKRTALVAVAVLCGAVGLALLVAASLAYVIHVRRSSDAGRRSTASGPGFGLLPRGCQEIRPCAL